MKKVIQTNLPIIAVAGNKSPKSVVPEFFFIQASLKKFKKM